ncbi:MBOAT family O-acyltransferase [Sulfurimonas sp. NW9]|uniref:MBOAT family O-acyltransferase n=1 Tax=Sulfurimonas sp. NW9 TaxID=2922728 RepID=UPI003DA7E149
MLFNSYDFIFLFLLPALFGFWVLKLHRAGVWFLIVASVVFYAQWNLQHLFILLGSLVVNYLFALSIERHPGYAKVLLSIILVLNLMPLVYYKYSYFLNMTDTPLILPLAISFFTFQQIAFQVDLYYKKIEFFSFKEYMFFILFFPQLVAGPIVHYRQVIPQVLHPKWKHFNPTYFSAGVFLFCVGLFKKVVLADSFAVYANSAFSHIQEGLSVFEAWIGLFAYSFEIYFDFSGYSDMAIGLGLLFGIRLPINFYSPYKSRNIIEFWRNWNITLSNFLRDYIYIPLGGNRVKISRQAVNLLLTMTIGGIWHGAGWTFILWGFLHGLLLGFVHLFRSHKSARSYESARLSSGTLLTFLTVTLLWVLFRADDFSSAMHYYSTLFNFKAFHLQAIDKHNFSVCHSFCSCLVYEKLL